MSAQNTNTNPASTDKPLPLVVQIGFAGSRNLFDPTVHSVEARAAFETELVGKLQARLQQLRMDLALNERHFFCGISQIAIGADMVFARACAASGILHRIFLPQPVDDYLTAKGSKGPDFSDDEQQTARRLLANANIIQVRPVSTSPNRDERFEDTNVEVVRVSDVFVCLARKGAGGAVGGTDEAQALAAKRGVPVLRLEVEVVGGVLVVSESWVARENFKKPKVPHAIEAVTMSAACAPSGAVPDIGEFYTAMKNIGSQQANWIRCLVAWAARIIIAAHVVATLLASIALAAHGSGVVPWLLGVELILLLAGFYVHRYLHKSHSVDAWALSRVVAEVSRAARATKGVHFYPEYFFHLPFPSELRPLLRTVNVLHLRASYPSTDAGWEGIRDTYLEVRLVSEAKNAQLPYHQQNALEAKRRLAVARWIFMLCSGGAIVATCVKFTVCLLTCCHVWHMDHEMESHLTSTLGVLAICLPVIAVAALSLAAVFDLEARVRVSGEMVTFLEEYSKLIRDATRPREFARLLLEVEYRLLGENVNWYFRRTFTGVS